MEFLVALCYINQYKYRTLTSVLKDHFFETQCLINCFHMLN